MSELPREPGALEAPVPAGASHGPGAPETLPVAVREELSGAALAAPSVAAREELSGAPRSARPARGIGVFVALLLALLTKGKSLLVLLKALPASKLLVTSFSMFAMVALEAQRSGFWFAFGFVLMILIHELGHGYAMKRCGVVAGWPIFIPFVGALISMKGEVRDRHDEAQIAYGGPVAGTASALAAAAIGLATGQRLFMVLAYAGFTLNLFNLTPLSPLDGGRVAQAFSRRAWIAGIALLALLFFTTGAPLLLLIGAIALSRVFSRAPQEAEREPLDAAQQRAWAVRYFGLAGFLALAIYFSGRLMS